jgi:hypothetical protein
MQGRPSQDNEPWDRFNSDRLAAVNGTGKQRTIPQRPSTMPRVDTPPATYRVARPKRQSPPPANWRRRLLILLGIFIVCGLLAWGIGYAVVNFFLAVNASAGAANTASDFLTNLSTQNYNQAFNDLDATITVNLTKDQFSQQALKDDRCYGPITNFTEVANSATSQDNTQSYTYSITRSKLTKPYPLQLTLLKDPDGGWNITSYGNNDDLGPGQPPCK